MQTQILIIEDDQPIRDGVCDALGAAGFGVVGESTGEAGLETFRNAAFDLLLLDIILPGRDGLSILTEIRQHRPGFPVILLTAKGDVGDRVRGLKLGADDYVVKPFSVQELLARIDAVLRRSPQRAGATGVVQIDEFCTADFEARTLTNQTTSLVLSEKEADLLRYLVANSGRVISRDELIQYVWSLDPRGLQSRTVDVHVGRLREKLSMIKSIAQIQTLRGNGYVFVRDR